ncbi:hypothetical protein FisN_14Hh143 [Fistulifera solaris]|jgi:beta-phosphoglucomutase-like phosphatase (HAD superfamily)|uniref:Uncharacterized protein n=1 Tax=Fistulifera solaris TaxID=1519565 RepID=A0A1Z5K8S3_FISSO|nr:hypothetical protein FisN_14Hh143 [Fistulifera solaris]|eukprot:GAX22521.1 hypothetical protein FisN_14Hh143 [Fistulifera solaris]
MVRNIDLPEALILYGSPIIWNDARSSWRSGLHELVEQCRADDAAVIMLVEDDSTTQDSIQQILTFPSGDLQVVLTETQLPPNPTDLLRALEALTIQPKAFGGSSGFARRQHLEPERHPLPQRSVVLTHTLDQTRAARAAGMRVVRLLLDSHDNDTLADVVVGEVVDFSIDDIATPGSFWLNPPHPRDDLGNRVDPYEIAFQRLDCVDDELPPNGGELNDDELQRILADIDPL